MRWARGNSCSRNSKKTINANSIKSDISELRDLAKAELAKVFGASQFAGAMC